MPLLEGNKHDTLSPGHRECLKKKRGLCGTLEAKIAADRKNINVGVVVDMAKKNRNFKPKWVSVCDYYWKSHNISATVFEQNKKKN